MKKQTLKTNNNLEKSIIEMRKIVNKPIIVSLFVEKDYIEFVSCEGLYFDEEDEEDTYHNMTPSPH
jgi:hypothetical protein